MSLDNEARGHIDLIKQTAEKIWGANVSFGEMNIMPYPHTEFEWSMNLYGTVDIMLYYDRSILGVAILKNGEAFSVSSFTDKSYVGGFESTEPEHLLENFMLLDEIVKQEFSI